MLKLLQVQSQLLLLHLVLYMLLKYQLLGAHRGWLCLADLLELLLRLVQLAL